MKSTWKVEEGGAIGRYLEHHRGHEIRCFEWMCRKEVL